MNISEAEAWLEECLVALTPLLCVSPHWIIDTALRTRPGKNIHLISEWSVDITIPISLTGSLADVYDGAPQLK